MHATVLDPVVSQAKWLAKGDDDLAQDIAAMAFDNYRRCQERGKDLSVGELVSFMKHRRSEISSGRRLPFGNVSRSGAMDVYRISNFFRGEVSILNWDTDEDEDDFCERGWAVMLSATKDISNAVIFNMGFEAFLKTLEDYQQKPLLMRMSGYSAREIGEEMGITPDVIRYHLKHVGKAFIAYFTLPPSYGVRYGLSG